MWLRVWVSDSSYLRSLFYFAFSFSHFCALLMLSFISWHIILWPNKMIFTWNYYGAFMDQNSMVYVRIPNGNRYAFIMKLNFVSIMYTPNVTERGCIIHSACIVESSSSSNWINCKPNTKKKKYRASEKKSIKLWNNSWFLSFRRKRLHIIFYRHRCTVCVHEQPASWCIDAAKQIFIYSRWNVWWLLNRSFVVPHPHNIQTLHTLYHINQKEFAIDHRTKVLNFQIKSDWDFPLVHM